MSINATTRRALSALDIENLEQRDVTRGCQTTVERNLEVAMLEAARDMTESCVWS